MSPHQLKKLSLLKEEVSYFRVRVATKKEGRISMKKPNPDCYDGCKNETKEEKIAKEREREKRLRSESNWRPTGMLSKPDGLDSNAKQ